MALNINKLLETNFSDLNVDIIAEPGRYYVSSAFTLAVNIISKRRVEDEAEISFMYYINDSIYSTFASVLTDIPRKYPPIFLVCLLEILEIVKFLFIFFSRILKKKIVKKHGILQCSERLATV